MNQLFNKVYHLILSSNNILLAAHRNPDGDAFGCLVALMNCLDRFDKKYIVFTPGPVKSDFEFLNKFEHVGYEIGALGNQNFDLILIVDSGDFGHVGLNDYMYSLGHRPVVVNIDHHDSNHYFGDVNIVSTDSSSSAEIIYNLFKANNIQVNPEIATALLLGILTDTDRFQTSSVNSNSIRVAGELLLKGARLGQINKHIFKSRPFQNLKLLGTALDHINFNEKYKTAFTVLGMDDFERAQTRETYGLANLLQNIEGARTTLILRQLPGGYIKGSLRTNRQDIDLTRLATLFNGGGHRQAAGFMLKGRLVKINGRWSIE